MRGGEKLEAQKVPQECLLQRDTKILYRKTIVKRLFMTAAEAQSKR